MQIVGSLVQRLIFFINHGLHYSVLTFSLYPSIRFTMKFVNLSNRHFQLNPILILEFDIGVRIIFLMDILKDNV